MNAVLWFLAGWISYAFVSIFLRTFRTYKSHRNAIKEIIDEVETINELVGTKVESSEGEMLTSFEMVLPDQGYREVVSRGMNVYLSQTSAQVLGQVYSLVGVLNQFFESSDPADPHKLYEIAENLYESSEDAVELLEEEIKRGVYSSYLGFLKFHTPF